MVSFPFCELSVWFVRQCGRIHRCEEGLEPGMTGEAMPPRVDLESVDPGIVLFAGLLQEVQGSVDQPHATSPDAVANLLV
jgi:hypothetical protein